MNNLLYYEKCKEVVNGYIDDLKNNSLNNLLDGNYSLAMDYLFLDKDDNRLKEEIILIIDYRHYNKVKDAILIIKNATKEDYERDLFVGYSVNYYSKDELIEIMNYLLSCLNHYISDNQFS